MTCRKLRSRGLNQYHSS